MGNRSGPVRFTPQDAVRSFGSKRDRFAMTSRRQFITAGTFALATAPAMARAHNGPPHTSAASMRRRDVDVRRDAQVGSVHVFTTYYSLYHITSPGRAREYHIAVGDQGRNLTGSTVIRRKAEWPSWTPTQNMIRREPEIYAQYAGGLPGGGDNPLGARALYLYRGGRDTMYRIHGTPQPWTIGRAVSSGCIRLTNEDIIDLHDRVEIGATVVFNS